MIVESFCDRLKELDHCTSCMYQRLVSGVFRGSCASLFEFWTLLLPFSLFLHLKQLVFNVLTYEHTEERIMSKQNSGRGKHEKNKMDNGTGKEGRRRENYLQKGKDSNIRTYVRTCIYQDETKLFCMVQTLTLLSSPFLFQLLFPKA